MRPLLGTIIKLLILWRMKSLLYIETLVIELQPFLRVGLFIQNNWHLKQGWRLILMMSLVFCKVKYLGLSGWWLIPESIIKNGLYHNMLMVKVAQTDKNIFFTILEVQNDLKAANFEKKIDWMCSDLNALFETVFKSNIQ